MTDARDHLLALGRQKDALESQIAAIVDALDAPNLGGVSAPLVDAERRGGLLGDRREAGGQELPGRPFAGAVYPIHEAALAARAMLHLGLGDEGASAPMARDETVVVEVT